MRAILRSDSEPSAAARLAAPFISVALAFPVLAFAALAGFVAVARLRVGHWPYYSHPDPKDLGNPVLHAAALLSYPVALITLPLGFLWLVRGGAAKRGDFILYVVGAALWAFFLPASGRIFEWLID